MAKSLPTEVCNSNDGCRGSIILGLELAALAESWRCKSDSRECSKLQASYRSPNNKAINLNYCKFCLLIIVRQQFL